MQTFEIKSTLDDNNFEFTVCDDEQVIFKALCRAENVQTTIKDKYNPNPLPNKVVNGSIDILINLKKS